MNSTLPPGLTLERAVNVSILIGPVELGVAIAILLFGCSIVQGYIYYSTFRDDPWFFKVLVASVLTVETGHIMCISAYIWSMTVTTYGNPMALAVFPAAADMMIVSTTLISISVQSFYIFRLTKFSNTRIFPALCAAILVLANLTCLIIAGKAFAMESLVQFETAIFRLIAVSLTAKAVCDLAIAIGMVYHLRNRRKSGFPRTAYIIDRLIRWTLETGILTGLNSISVLVFFLTMSNNFIWIGLYTFLACTYANSFLASRVNVFSKRLDHEAYEINNISNVDSGGSNLSRINPIVIGISKTVERSPSPGGKLTAQASLLFMPLGHVRLMDDPDTYTVRHRIRGRED
ncbi:hypothetical protein BJ138DRAFT_1114579 [Hygrophoropsis aurantiaca]|uniref:Uncharacterized protein n=1 Tax=Hygrophoropsis aurantiaca TaxID=72124 RepID=A0ACB8AA64_9AGAM|nr:hypothetical protein BJ138DRAFT_1114579 [Hygrophoropsis aurantiaca]